MSAIDKAKPYLNQAFDGSNQQPVGQQEATSAMTDTDENIQQTQGTVTNNIQAPSAPVWQDQQMARQNGSKNYTMANKDIITPATGSCPNGCKAPHYDNQYCAEELINGKEYRKCPWTGDATMNKNACIACGAVLIPKNKYGYARTRPGLFDSITLDAVIKQTAPSSDDIQGKTQNKNYLKIGKEFMEDLSRIKDFSLPSISDKDYIQLGKLIYKYEIDKTTRLKHHLTHTINHILDTQALPMKGGYLISSNKTPRKGLSGEGGNYSVQDKLSGTDINAQYQNKKEAQSDNRLGGSSTAYRKNYKPIDPNKDPRPYDSIWDIFHS